MIDFMQIQSDLRDMIAGGTYTDTIKEFFIEAMERDMMLGNMPCVNVTLPKAELSLTRIPNGYESVLNYRISVVAMDFTEFKKAAIVRDRILKEVMMQIQANADFSALISSSKLGPEVDFVAGIATADNQIKGHIASAEFDVSVEVSTEAT